MIKHAFETMAAVCLAAGLLAAGGCGQARTNITVAGSTAFQPFAEKLADEFMAQNPTLGVTVQGGGSAVGIRSALAGTAEIGMADLVSLPAEAKELTSLVVARDGIAVIVHPSNSITNLSMEQLRGVFSGTVSNWQTVGGPDKPITVVSREAGSGTRTSFEQIADNLQLTKEAIVQDSSGTIRETVANDANAIGYITHGVINDKVKPLTIDGVDSTTEEILAGRYQLVRPVFFLTRGQPEGPTKAFIDYVLSAEGQKTIQQNGLIPVK